MNDPIDSYYEQANDVAFPLNIKDSDDDDSDARQLFELPKRKIVRPPTTIFRRKIGSKTSCLANLLKGCRSCITWVLPLILGVFVVTLILGMVLMLFSISSMKNEIQILKIQLSNVQDSEKTSVYRRDKLRKDFQRKLEAVESEQTSLKILRDIVKKLERKVENLNSTLFDTFSSPSFHLSGQVISIKHSVETIETGMADTGADIEELKGGNKKVVNDILKMQEKLDGTISNLFNLSVSISHIQNKPPPSWTTTPKTLVVSMTPDDEQLVKRKEMEARLKEFRNDQQLLCIKNEKKYFKELDSLKNLTQMRNEQQTNTILILTKKISNIQVNYSRITSFNHTRNVPPSSPLPGASATQQLNSNAFQNLSLTTVVKPLITSDKKLIITTTMQPTKNNKSLTHLNTTLSQETELLHHLETGDVKLNSSDIQNQSVDDVGTNQIKSVDDWPTMTKAPEKRESELALREDSGSPVNTDDDLDFNGPANHDISNYKDLGELDQEDDSEDSYLPRDTREYLEHLSTKQLKELAGAMKASRDESRDDFRAEGDEFKFNDEQ